MVATAFTFFCSLLAVGLAVPTTTPFKRAASGTKYVIAHHMVGNTYPYVVSDWAKDIALAYANGIDAFALNVGSDSWQKARVADAYAAAKASNTGFKVFLSFDMSSLPCASASDAASLVTWATTYTTHSNQFKYPAESPKAFISTFSGENCKFGQSSAGTAWKSLFKDKFTGSNAVYFVPSFFVDPTTFGSTGLANSMDGDFHWNSAWPISTTTSSLNTLLSKYSSNVDTLPSAAPGSAARNAVQSLVGSLDSDNTHINALKSLGTKAYMAGMSPWFFTHYSPQTYNKNFVYLSGSLYPTRWASLIQSRSTVDLVELISWNDYGESHYLGPIEGAQPNSQAWVNGFDHTAWLDMTSYYATAFKTGTYPKITKDKIYMWARPHLKDATATSDSTGKPTNYAVSEDSAFALVFAQAASTVWISSSSCPCDTTQGHTFTVPAGVTQLNVPLYNGMAMRATLARNGQTLVNLAPDGYKCTNSPTTYNYNAFVAMATS